MLKQEQKLKFFYSDGMDLLNALEYLAKTLPSFGVNVEILDGGDGYEEIKLTKINKFSPQEEAAAIRGYEPC